MIPALTRPFRVLWYEAPAQQSILVSMTAERRVLPRRPAKRLAVFTVDARTLDHARDAAKTYAEKRGAKVLSANFSQRPDEIILYSEAK